LCELLVRSDELLSKLFGTTYCKSYDTGDANEGNDYHEGKSP
jgi:hypothetical protein